MPEYQPAQKQQETEMQPATAQAALDNEHDPRSQYYYPTGQGEDQISHTDAAIRRSTSLHSSHCRQPLAPKRRHEQIPEQHDDSQDVHNFHQRVHRVSSCLERLMLTAAQRLKRLFTLPQLDAADFAADGLRQGIDELDLAW